MSTTSAQHEAGIIHMWLFDQHQVWVDRQGLEHEIEMMPRDYIQNVIWFLRHQDVTLYSCKLNNVTIDLAIATLSQQTPKAKALLAQLENMGIEEVDCMEDLPRSWLDQTPLMRALIRRLGFDPPRIYPPEFIDPGSQ